MNKSRISSALALMACLASSELLANSGGNAPAEGINYIPVSPPLVVNYGGPNQGRPRYIKAELSIRTENAADATEVMHHLPLIRDKLISLISAQSEEQISSLDGKEKLREQALREINSAIHAVEFGAGDAKASVAQQAAEGESHKADAEHGGHGEGEASTHGDAPAHGDASAHGDAKDDHGEAHAGPASDLFFNNFVVQK